MANFISKCLHKSRFLIVGALVMTLMSAPFMTQAGSKNPSEATIVAADSTIAGLSTEIAVDGKSYEPVEVSITKPNGSQLVLEAVTNASGSAELTLADYHVRTAGVYTVEARHLSINEGYGPAKTFEVYPGAVSDTKSTATLSKSTAEAGETLEMLVTLQDSYENPIDGHVLKVSPSKNGVSVYSPDFATDEDGEMTFYITSETKGVADLTVFDTSINKTLTTKPKVAFLSGDGTYDQGGWGDNYAPVLAAESGQVDSFVVSMDDSSVEVGETVSVTVTAVDEDNFTVSDYTGEVRFSSTDEEATLPNDYTFEADDLGEHTFSLSVKFITPGDQTLTITDTDQTTVEGEVTVEVIDEDADYGADFETEDYERDGDFTLISPASGSYSADTIEVQGEADYGYFAIIYVNDEEAGRTEIEFDNSFTYSLEGLEDGTYVIYVDVAELDDTGDDYEDAEILDVIEESDSETVEIDTTAPEIVSISSDPDGAAEAYEVVTVTVLSESDLEEAYLLFEDEIYELEETVTAGKYEAELVMPAEEGEYTVDVVLMDALGNEVQYRDELTLTVSASTDSEDEDSGDADSEDEDSEDEDTTMSDGEVGQVTGVMVTEDEEAVIVSWEAAESDNSIAYYRIYYGPSEESLYAISDTFDSSTSWMITDLLGDQVYYFAVAAVDVEGTEGELSGVAVGVALAKEGSDITEDDDVPTGEEDPEIEGAETPDSTPESGPATTALLLASLMGSAGYAGMRRKIRK